MSHVLEQRLVGRRVLITRAEDDCAEWAVELERRGAIPVLLPCIQCEPINRPTLRAAVLAALPTADWLAFTSRRGVDAFVALLEAAQAEAREQAIAAGETAARPPRRGTLGVPATCRIAVVGAATAAAARKTLGRADLVGSGTAAELGAALVADGELEARPNVLLAVAANAGDMLEGALRSAGARPTRVDVYRTVPAPLLAQKRAWSTLGADNVVLASPSAATGFVQQIDLDTPAPIFTIGPSTTAAARELGLDVTAEARKPSLEGILEAMQWRK